MLTVMLKMLRILPCCFDPANKIPEFPPIWLKYRLNGKYAAAARKERGLFSKGDTNMLLMTCDRQPFLGGRVSWAADAAPAAQPVAIKTSQCVAQVNTHLTKVSYEAFN